MAVSHDALQKSLEFVNTQTSFVKNLSKRSWTQPTVTWNNHSRIWTLAAQDHVAALLPSKYEANFFQDLPEVIAGQIGRELHLLGAS
jgi:hypothetical protein